jgi:hypothetical protein
MVDKEKKGMADGLNGIPPSGIPKHKEYGGSVQNGDYMSTCIGWRLTPNNENCAWVGFINEEAPDEGRFDMTLFLPTKEALNAKANELKGTVPPEGLQAAAMKKFFHYGMTMRVAGIALETPIKEALDALTGWHGKSRYKTDNYGTKVTEILSAKEAKAVRATSGGDSSDVPF